ncbi:MAG: sulfatase-like hydrolase/transferase [Planctomycetales bacterium]|nr:sulfatase-like hydrolase/transferase [Planctomycetales bacterium]
MRKSVRLLFLPVFLVLSGLAVDCAAARPNILWITSEDHGPEMGCYGDKLARTPHVDALARRGLRFQLAWSCAPVCAPARTTIITGLYPPSCGGQHMRSMVTLPSHIKMYPMFLREAGYYCTNNSKTDYNVQLAEQATIWDDTSRQAHYKNRPADAPFFAIFNSTVSHESKIRAAGHKPVTSPADVRVPAYHPDNAETRKDWAQYYDIVSQADEIAGKHLKQLEEAGLADETIVFYYGDHGSGMSRSKRWPYNSGLSVPMVVYFPDKYRDLAPKEYQPGGASQRMVNFVDLAPTLLSLAGVKPPEWMQGHAFAGKHQTEPPRYMFGFRDRMDERYDLIRTVTDGRFQYIRNYNPHFIYGQHVAYNFVTPSTAAWKRDYDAGKLNEAQSRFWQLKPAEELYDLRSDPDEVVNLAESPEHREKLNELRDALRQWCLEIRDLGFLPEGEIHSRSAGSTPYEMARDESKYPLHRILEAADVSTRRAPEDVPQLRRWLFDQDSAVRYWAAVGLLNRGEAVVRQEQGLLTIGMHDGSAYVSTAAAYALGQFGSPQQQRSAVERLVELSRWGADGNVFAALTAANALDKLDGRAAFLKASIEQLPTNGDSPNARYNGYLTNVLKKTLSDLQE